MFFSPFCSTVCVFELVQDAFRRFDLNTVYSPFIQPTTCVNSAPIGIQKVALQPEWLLPDRLRAGLMCSVASGVIRYALMDYCRFY